MNKPIVGSTGFLMAILGYLWGCQYAGNYGGLALAGIGFVVGLLYEIARNTARKE